MGGDEKNPLRQLLEADLNVALHAAITDGDPAVERDLLRSGADPDAVATLKGGDSQVVASTNSRLWTKGTLRSCEYFWR